MAVIRLIEPDGTLVELHAPPGWTLMQLAMGEGVAGIDAECGGSCACATCHCYVENLADQLPPPSANEQSMLAGVAAERRPNSRLSCQISLHPGLDGLTVRFPDRQS
jgi:2Fe-2S ferredoxin